MRDKNLWKKFSIGFPDTSRYLRLPEIHDFPIKLLVSTETEDSVEVTSVSLSSQSARQTGPVNLEISQSDLGK